MSYDIRFVALYLRKSRGDEEKDLQKHRNTLVEICDKNGWKYVEYVEIGSSDSIDMRPKFKQLLNEIETELYDAILVMDYDRLSRGDLGDQSKIKKAFQKSNTLIITPSKVYDLNNDLDDTYSDFQGLFARVEYKTITRRLRQGKKAGAKMGNWTNGIPPFPYEYQRWENKYNEKGLVVNDDKLEIYRYIIGQALNNITPQNIAIDLNKKNVPSPSGRKWTNVTIHRILVDETHLGKIITNKTIGDGHKIKKSSAKAYRELPRSEWNIVENCHQAVKTQLEHDTIIEIIEKRKLVPTRARASTYELSGLIKCGVCGYGSTFQRKKNGYILLKPCWHVSDIGEKCSNRVGSYKDLLNTVKSEVKTFLNDSINQLLNSNEKMLETDIKNFKNDMNKKQKEYDKYISALNKVNESYELGDYKREEWLQRRANWETKIYQTKNEIESLERKIDNLKRINPEDRIKYYNDILLNLDSLNVKDLNNVYRKLIKSIVWTRIGEDAEVEIEYN
jgi:DNA invertase Pin-like site-specific DNA recombinase